MNDQTTADIVDDAEDEMTLLKQRADLLKIKYSPAIGLAALRERVNAAVTGEPEPEVQEPVVASVVTKTKDQRDAELRKAIYDEEMKLVRLRITNLNPQKKDLEGEIYCVANRYLGNVKKYVPFGEVTDNGYHVPNVIYKHLQEVKFLQVKVRKDPQRPNHEIVTQRWVSEFALEVLPPLTAEELQALAIEQKARVGYEE